MLTLASYQREGKTMVKTAISLVFVSLIAISSNVVAEKIAVIRDNDGCFAGYEDDSEQRGLLIVYSNQHNKYMLVYGPIYGDGKVPIIYYASGQKSVEQWTVDKNANKTFDTAYRWYSDINVLHDQQYLSIKQAGEASYLNVPLDKVLSQFYDRCFY